MLVYKLAPVDTDLFPEGLEQPDTVDAAAGRAGRRGIHRDLPRARNLLIVPRQPDAQRCLPGQPVAIAADFPHGGPERAPGLPSSPDLKKPQTLTLPDGETLTLEPVVRVKGASWSRTSTLAPFLLNNDLSAGVPGILEDLHLQYLLPPFHAGWSLRRRSNHLKCLEEVSQALWQAHRGGPLAGSPYA